MKKISEDPGLNRGHLDLQSNTLPLSYPRTEYNLNYSIDK